MLKSQPMLFHRLSRAGLSGLLIAALLLQSLLPAVAGVQRADGSRWIEVCASSGTQWVKLDQAGHEPATQAGDHCAWCSSTGAVAEFDVARYLPPEDGGAFPVSPRDLEVAAFPGHALLSRGPPALIA